jgi:hypothetical protein
LIFIQNVKIHELEIGVMIYNNNNNNNNNIPGNHEVMELQKTAKLGTAHILR